VNPALKSLLERAIAANERQAAALERIADWLDPKSEPISDDERLILEQRDDNLLEVDEQVLAVVELLEEKGDQVPLAVYERLHIEPPDNRERPIDKQSLNSAQPGASAGDEQPVTYRKGR
jgi:hypothetical protein